MQMTPEARAWLDAAVRRILARHPLGDAERMGITYELMSHLHAAGEARASAAGRAEVAREDLEAALAEAGGEAGLAAAFVQPLAKPLVPASPARRLAALGVDTFLVVLGLVGVHALLEILLAIPMQATGEAHVEGRPNWLIPWGFHDPSAPTWVQGLFTLASAAFLLGYFAWFEAKDGRTPGKRALDLRVVRANGEPVAFKEALVRNVAKVSPPLLLVDGIVMLLRSDHRRLSDKVADTLVVRA